jgi:SHS2 domain-containing protein
VTNTKTRASFHILEHPSDLGIEASGPSIREAFEQAALGLISVIVEPETVAATEERWIEVEAADYEHLLVKWLSELLYLYDGEDFLFSRTKIESINPSKLTARVLGEKYQAGKHKMKLDVKAITYHQLSVKTKDGVTTIRVFVDI